MRVFRSGTIIEIFGTLVLEYFLIILIGKSQSRGEIGESIVLYFPKNISGHKVNCIPNGWIEKKK